MLISLPPPRPLLCGKYARGNENLLPIFFRFKNRFGYFSVEKFVPPRFFFARGVTPAHYNDDDDEDEDGVRVFLIFFCCIKDGVMCYDLN